MISKEEIRKLLQDKVDVVKAARENEWFWADDMQRMLDAWKFMAQGLGCIVTIKNGIVEVK